uniref:Armadillo repeat containing 6 n=1 Tax=Erpetoichthys calabaricus TaxID=27687 RepID=A0A8C4SUW2_ERPCA
MTCKQITQETFDAAVRENIIDFEMEPEEALREAIEQFESQGVDLHNIVKTVVKNSYENDEERQSHQVLEALETLQKSTESSLVDQMADSLATFTEQCKLDFANRYLAAQKGAYSVILSICNLWQGEKLLCALTALSALTEGQPDLLDSEGKELLISLLQDKREELAQTLVVVRIVRHCCVKHEQNRQDLVKDGILSLLTKVIKQNLEETELVKEACAALRVMTFDDDVRVPFGHAHEHARMIVIEHNGLKVITDAAKAHMENLGVLSELCATLSRLAVRNEYCQDIVDLGGLNLMLNLLAGSLDNQELVKQVLNALRAIAGNDDVKDAISASGGIQITILALNRHVGSSQVCEQGCAALSMLALRKPENCRIIMENGGVPVVLQAMKAHPNETNLQKQACMVLRNLVSRTRDFSSAILDLGGETLINQAMVTHRDCEDAAKAALRDLGCKVELRELWTGKKGGLSH